MINRTLVVFFDRMFQGGGGLKETSALSSRFLQRLSSAPRSIAKVNASVAGLFLQNKVERITRGMLCPNETNKITIFGISEAISLS